MAKLDLSTLESRPPWRIVLVLKLLVAVAAVLSAIAIISGMAFSFMYNLIPIEEETARDLLIGTIGTFLENVGYYGLSFAFYAVLLWLAAQAVDRLDQLVWLRADETDRLYIYNQRIKKKNDKNQ